MTMSTTVEKISQKQALKFSVFGRGASSYRGMRYIWLLLVSLLFSAPTIVQAQRSGGVVGTPASSGNGSHMGWSGNGSRAGHPNGLSRGQHGVFHRDNGFRRGNGAAFLPGYYYPYDGYDDYWDLPGWTDELYSPDQEQEQEESYQSPAPASPQPRAAAVYQQPAASPKLVEVPQEAAPAKASLPAVFVLTNGEKIESSRYVLSAESLKVDVNRSQRTIPLNQINIPATVAENHQRGIELTIPRNNNSLFLSF